MQSCNYCTRRGSQRRQRAIVPLLDHARKWTTHAHTEGARVCADLRPFECSDDGVQFRVGHLLKPEGVEGGSKTGAGTDLVCASLG